MKKMFCLLFILLPILAGAQTRPDWLDIKNKPYNDVRDSGVKGDGVTDDWTALKNAIERGGLVVIPAGLTIVVSGTQSDVYTDWIRVATDTTIVNLGSTISQATGTWARYTLPISVEADFTKLSIYGLRLTGNFKSHVGLSVRRLVGSTGGRVAIEDGFISSLAAPTNAAFMSCGVYVEGAYEAVEIKRNVVRNVTRTKDVGSVGAQAASGIVVAKLRNTAVSIATNNIQEIRSNVESSWADADAIGVFADDPVELNPQQNVEIHGNFILNFSGRAIKLQTPGAHIHDNTILCASGTQMVNSAWIDVQSGRAFITNNYFWLGASVTPGASHCFLGLQGIYTNHRIIDASHNTFISEQDIAYLMLPAADGEKDTVIRLTDNTVQLDAGDLFVCYVNTPGTTVATGSVTLDISRNKFVNPLTYSLVYLAGAYHRDLSRATKWNIHIVDNTVQVESTTHNAGFLLSGDENYDICAGWTKISGNSGWKSGARFTPLMTRVLPGSNFYFNGTASYTFDSSIADVGGRNNLYIQRGEAGFVTIASGTTMYVGFADIETPTASWTWKQLDN